MEAKQNALLELIELQFQLLSRQENKSVLLAKAASENKLNVFQFLLSQSDVDVTQACWNGLHALHYAAANGNNDMVQMLLDKKVRRRHLQKWRILHSMLL